MPEPHARGDLQKTRVNRSACSLGRNSEVRCGKPEDVRISARLDGQKQEQHLRGGRQLPKLVQEVLLEADSQRKRFRKRGDSRQLVGGELGRQFDQRERIAVGLSNEAISDALVQGPRNDPAEKLSALVGGEPDNPKARDAVERNSRHRRLVHAEETGARLLADCVAKKRENGKAHEKDVRRVATVEPESRLESRSLPIG